MKRSQVFLISGLLSVASAVCAHAVKSDRMVEDTYADFAKGISRSVSISDDGMLVPAPTAIKEAEIESGQIWSAVAMPDGTVLLGTSPEGKLQRVGRDGKCALVHKFAESHLYAVAKGQAGEVFVGTSPDGKIYKLDLRNKPTVYFDPKEKYIWALLADSRGVLYAATGIQGKIYRITGEGKGEVYFQSDETHIRTLAWDKDGNLLAGSADSGYLYRITGKGQGVVLHSTGRQEVNRIAVAPDGTIYFSALGTAKTATPVVSIAGGVGLRSVSITPPSDSKDPASSSSTPTVTPLATVAILKPASSSLSSGLYKLDSSLFASQIWTSKDNILTLDWSKDTLYVGTGGEGYIYSINERGQAVRVLKLEVDNISTSLRLSNGELIYASSNPGRTYRLATAKAMPGIYESEVIDATTFAKWGAVSIQGSGGVEIRTRSGNTPKPDKSWYGWQALRNGISQSPPARYMQVELSLFKEASVKRLEAYFLAKNLPPHIEQVELLAAGIGYAAIPTPPQQPQVKSSDQILTQATKNEPDSAAKITTRFQPTESKSLRTVTWKANDPNNDELTYTVYYRRDNTRDWRLLAKDLKDTVLSWDSSGWPDGNYYLKVEASDSTDNSPSETLKDEMQSRMLTLDSVPPLIRVDAVRGGKVSFTVQKEVSRLTAVSISSDGREYKAIRPVDGILDQKMERFEAPLKAGEALFIRAEDECGNVSGAMAQAP